MSPPLPYCTPHRQRLVQAIRAGNIRWYHFKSPVALIGDSNVTDAIRKLIAAKLVTVPAPDVPGGWSKPVMTTAGDEWYQRQLDREAER